MLSLYSSYDKSLNDLLLRTIEHTLYYNSDTFEEALNLIDRVGLYDFNKYAAVLNFVQVVGNNYNKINEARSYADLEFELMSYYFSKIINR